MPATKVAVVPYLVAIVYLSTFVRYSDFVTFSHIPHASHFIHISASLLQIYSKAYGSVCSFTVPKLWISQSETLLTVMIFYDIKSLTWYPTVSWTVPKIRTFLQTLEMKITTEIQRNAKLLHFLNKVICLTLTEKKKFRAKIGRGRSRVLVYKQRWNFFASKWSRIFPNFSLNFDFQVYENETPQKRILKK